MYPALVVGRRLAAGLCLLVCSAASMPGADTDFLMREKLAQLSVQTSASASGRFLVSCRDTRLHMPVLQWAERVYADVQQGVGGMLTFDGRQMVILIVEEGAEAGIEAFSFPVLFRQRIQLPAPMLGTPDADTWLVRALLGAARTPEGGWQPVDTPWWLWTGVAGQLTPERRALAMDRALMAWRRGALASPAQLLGVRGVAPVADPLAAVALVRWFGASGRTSRHEGLRAALIDGGAAAAGPYVDVLLSGGDASQLQERWDMWLERERDVVHAVGMVSERLLRRFDAELLLSEGVCGIPKGAFGGASVGVSTLPMWASEPWFRLFAREKRVRLELLVAGRGYPLVELAGFYIAYLDDLQAGRLADATGHLAAAEASHAALEERLAAAGGSFFEPVKPTAATGSVVK